MNPDESFDLENRSAEVYRRRKAAAMRKTRYEGKKLSVLFVAACLIVVFFAIALAWYVFSVDNTQLNGTFAYDEVTVYVFDGAGKGTMHTAVDDYAFTYTVRWHTVAIDYENEAAKDRKYSFELTEDMLTLIQGDTRYLLHKQ